MGVTTVNARMGALPWRPARELGAGLDVLLAAGPRYAAQRWREQRLRQQRARATGDATYARIWGQAASELGADLVELGDGFFEARRTGLTTRVWRHWVMLDDAVTLKLALDKAGVHRLLAERGLPIPAYRAFSHRDAAAGLGFLESIGGGAVVKPASGTGSGSGVTSGVRTREHLLRGILRAGRLDTRILIEEQAAGEMYRLLFLDGELLGVVRRRIPRLVGDGSSTVAALIASENRRRLTRPGGMMITVDLDTVLALERQSLSLRSVPPRDSAVMVKGIPSQNAFEDNDTVTPTLAPDVVEAARAAVEAVGLRLGGVDLVTRDPYQPLAQTGGAIVEVNGTPGLHYHYQVSDPERADRVAIPILARLLGLSGEGNETSTTIETGEATQ